MRRYRGEVAAQKKRPHLRGAFVSVYIDYG